MLGRNSYIEHLEIELERLEENHSELTDLYDARKYTYMSRETFEDTASEIESDAERIRRDLERARLPLAERIELRRNLKTKYPHYYKGKAEWVGKIKVD